MTTEITSEFGAGLVICLVKFTEYWLEGKRKLKNTTLACHNWLDRCLERNGGNLSKSGGRDSSNPGKFYGQKFDHMIQR